MLANGFRPSFVSIALAPTLIGIAYVIERWRGRACGLDWRELCLCGGYLVLSEQAVRNAFLCLLPLLFMLQRMAAGGRRQRVGFACAALLLTGIAAEDALPYAYGGVSRIAEIFPLDLSPGAFPELAADFLDEAGIEGGIANDGRFGGYLIWRAWPRCSVFADSRHHLSSVMWPVFNAIHDPLRRPAGLEVAFAKWGTELTAFRGPTFPLGAPPQFRLLYKAGDQEIYQDLRGRHAALNLARTRTWLSRRGVAVPDDESSPAIPALAAQWGAERYLAASYQRLRAREAARLIADANPGQRGHGLLERGQLLYEVGSWREAAALFERASALLPGAPDPIYDAALSYFSAGDVDGFQRMDARLRGVSSLSARKLEKLRRLRIEIEQRKRVARGIAR
jgi:tetratricopeptide (TPR) repeat protein